MHTYLDFDWLKSGDTYEKKTRHATEVDAEAGFDPFTFLKPEDIVRSVAVTCGRPSESSATEN